MSYKNSMKLFASNFNFVWKQLVYLICCILLLAISSYTTIRPIISLLAENNIGAEFEVLFQSIYNSPNEIGLMVSNVIRDILLVVFRNFGEIYLSFIFAILLCIILPFILLKMSIYNLSSIAYQKLTMNMTTSYSRNAVSTFKAGLKYSFASILFDLPFIMIDAFCVFIYLAFARTILSALIGLIFLSTITMIVESIKIAIFAHYTGLVVSGETNMFKAFGKSFGIVFTNFWKNIATSIILHITIVVVNGFILVFTFFAGLLISIPATFVLMAFYYIVSYLNTIGQRYYLADTIIYNPVEYVVKKDDFVTISVPEVTTELKVTTTKIKKPNKKSKSN